MNVTHHLLQGDPAASSASSASETVWMYRTEVHNPGDRPLRVVWFQFFFQSDCGSWTGINARNRPLRNADFLDWYGDAEALEDGWLLPGRTAVCDPNYHLAFPPEYYPVKWAFLAVDPQGRDQLVEAMVPREVVTLVEPT